MSMYKLKDFTTFMIVCMAYNQIGVSAKIVLFLLLLVPNAFDSYVSQSVEAINVLVIASVAKLARIRVGFCCVI